MLSGRVECVLISEGGRLEVKNRVKPELNSSEMETLVPVE